MKNKKDVYYTTIIKYGQYFSEFPISAFVLLSDEKKTNFKGIKKINLIGTLVKKKSLKKLFIEIE
ncbi:hypothetical protein [Blattabacterium cuenoti]|uniref:hypothetical protein n=1 Tax=Blattabacterium cuenoti TaxID=1653831 RepID=UPI00163CFBE9|nr:hypothetical protein [Blattabacterium cuenoti]